MVAPRKLCDRIVGQVLPRFNALFGYHGMYDGMHIGNGAAHPFQFGILEVFGHQGDADVLVAQQGVIGAIAKPMSAVDALRIAAIENL